MIIGGHRGRGCTDHDFYQDIRDIAKLPVENTQASILDAFARGADYIETDAVMSADGVIFILHNVVPKDHFFGARQPAALLNTMNFSEIEAFHTGRKEGGTIARLSDVLAAIAVVDPGTAGWCINIEIKGVQGSGQPYETNDYLARLAETVKASPIALGRILFSSFCLQNILRMSHLLPEAQYGLLFGEKPEPRGIYADHGDDLAYQYIPFTQTYAEKAMDLWRAEGAYNTRLTQLNPEVQTITPEMLRFASRHALGVNSWGLFENLDASRKDIYRNLLREAFREQATITIITDYVPELRALRKSRIARIAFYPFVVWTLFLSVIFGGVILRDVQEHFAANVFWRTHDLVHDFLFFYIPFLNWMVISKVWWRQLPRYKRWRLVDEPTFEAMRWWLVLILNALFMYIIWAHTHQ